MKRASPPSLLKGLKGLSSALLVSLLLTAPARGAEPVTTHIYTLNDAVAALRLADAQGDVKAARRLARIASAMQSSPNQLRWVVYEIDDPKGRRHEIKAPEGVQRAELISALKNRIESDERKRLKERLAEIRAQKFEPKGPSQADSFGAKMARLWGPSDPAECYAKHSEKLKIPDAVNLLQLACNLGYSGGYRSEWQEAGRCVAKSEGVYSLEQGLGIISRCTSDVGAFTALRKALYKRQDREREERAEAAEERYNQLLLGQQEQRSLLESNSQRLNDLTTQRFLYGK